MFAYVAKAEGRKLWTHEATRNATLVSEGKALLTNRDKAEKLASAFSVKMTVQRQPEGEDGNIPAWRAPLAPFEERVEGSHNQVSNIEISKAIKSLKTGKAPGPDGIPAMVYKKLPSLIPHIQRLLNISHTTGHIPTLWRRLHLAPTPKSGKDPHEATS